MLEKVEWDAIFELAENVIWNCIGRYSISDV